MALFKLTALNNRAAMIVRAKCMSCARSVAVENAGAEGTMVWRDPSKSRVELIQDTGKPALIHKTE